MLSENIKFLNETEKLQCARFSETCRVQVYVVLCVIEEVQFEVRRYQLTLSTFHNLPGDMTASLFITWPRHAMCS